MKYRKKIGIVLFLSTLLNGCSSTKPNFYDMSASYAIALGQYQQNNIFLNIVRASEKMPMSFLDIPSILGTGMLTVSPSVTGSVGAAVFGSGMAGPSGLGLSSFSNSVTSTLSVTNMNQFTFTQSSLDNATFWKSFLSKVPLSNVEYFMQNRTPKEVIYSLVIDAILIIKSDGEIVAFNNDPLDKSNHLEFQKILYKLIDAGLTISTENPHSQTQKNNKIGATKDNLAADKLTDLPNEFRFCIDGPRNSKNLDEMNFDDSLFCNGKGIEKDKKITGKSNLRINLRSAKNIYDYLGAVVKAQLEDTNPVLVTLPPSSYTSRNERFRGSENHYALLVVKKNETTSSYVTAEGLQNNVYTVPISNDGYSRLTLELASQIITLSKIPGSAAPSPALLVK
jgi:hypothetical protein